MQNISRISKVIGHLDESTKKKGTLTTSKEWAKHLRPSGKKQAAKAERKASKKSSWRENDVEDRPNYGTGIKKRINWKAEPDPVNEAKMYKVVEHSDKPLDESGLSTRALGRYINKSIRDLPKKGASTTGKPAGSTLKKNRGTGIKKAHDVLRTRKRSKEMDDWRRKKDKEYGPERMTGDEYFGEDGAAPANSAGGGSGGPAIAAIGINNPNKSNTWSEPGRPGKLMRRRQFGEMEVFVIPTKMFEQSRMGKRKYLKYEEYVGNDDIGEEIRKYGRDPKTAHKPIIVMDEASGAMCYLKYGK
jgi:hypothetical protein